LEPWKISLLLFVSFLSGTSLQNSFAYDYKNYVDITFDPQQVEQGHSVTISISPKTVSVSNPDQQNYVFPKNIMVTVVTPDNNTSFEWAPGLHVQYPGNFNLGGSTSKLGKYFVEVSVRGVLTDGTSIYTYNETSFTVIPPLPPQPQPAYVSALYAGLLSVAGMGVYGVLIRIGIVKENPAVYRTRKNLARLSFLADYKIWMPVSFFVIIVSAIFFPLKIYPILVLSLTIVALWAGQTATSEFFRRRLYDYYERGSGLYIFGWMSVALHEGSHTIINIIFGGKIEKIFIDVDHGRVDSLWKLGPFRTWLGMVFGSLAPAYFVPAILLLIWFLAAGIQINPPYQPLTVDMYTPFNHFMALGFINFFYWIVTNFSNPWMYVFMYLFVTTSIAAGPSPPGKDEEGWSGDWMNVLRTIKDMPKHTLTFVLGFLSIVSVIALLDYDIIVGFFGFWLLLFILVFISQIIAFVFTRLTLAQGIALIILAIVVNVIGGYVITEFVPAFKNLQCSLNPNYC
jgi:hypothetical protein